MSQYIDPKESVRLLNRGVAAGSAPVVGQTVSAVTDSAIVANLAGSIAHDGWLFGEIYRSTTEYLVAQNGEILKDGAVSDIGFVGSYYTSTCAGLYLQVMATRIRLAVSNVVGTFVTGDLVTQATSGAVGRYVRMDGSTMVLGLVSGTFDGSHSLAGSAWTVPAIGTQQIVNPTFTGAAAGSPGTWPTSWVNLFTTGDLAVSGATLTFTTTTRFGMYQSRAVSAGVYAATIQATKLSGTFTLLDIFALISPPAGSTVAYFVNDLPVSSSSTFTGTVTIKIVLTCINSGTVQFRVGVGLQSNITASIQFTAPLFGTSSAPTPTISADVSSVEITASRRFLSRSLDGFTPFYPVLDFEAGATGSTLLRCLIDCGEIDIGGTLKKTLIWTTYNEAPDCQVYVNHPDDNDTWTLLFNADFVGGVRPIRHWHGGHFIPGLGPNEGTLVLFSGDTDGESGIYGCEDVADFIANPMTWFARWGLDKSGQDRLDFLAGQPKEYVWTYGDQSSRTVDMVVDKNSEYAYYLPDSGAASRFGPPRLLHRVNLATKEIDAPDRENQYAGEGWYGCLCRGVPVITDLSRWQAGVGVNGSDEYVHAFAVDNNRLVKIKRWRNTLVPSGVAQGTQIFAWNDWIFGKGVGAERFGTPWTVSATGAVASDLLPTNVLLSQVVPPALNCFSNPKFADGFTGTEVQSTAAIVTDVIDSEYAGVRSLRITPTSASGAGRVAFDAPAEILEYLRGKWITLSVRYLAPTSLPSTQLPYIGFGQMYTGAASQVIPIPKGDTWQTASWMAFVPPKATGIPVWLYATVQGTDTDPVWFSDVCLAEGRNVAYRNKQFVNVFGIA